MREQFVRQPRFVWESHDSFPPVRSIFCPKSSSVSPYLVLERKILHFLKARGYWRTCMTRNFLYKLPYKILRYGWSWRPLSAFGKWTCNSHSVRTCYSFVSIVNIWNSFLEYVIRDRLALRCLCRTMEWTWEACLEWTLEYSLFCLTKRNDVAL